MIEAVTVCHNYSDYLSQFLLCNNRIFDRLVVVTGENEYSVTNLCRHYNVECVQTNLFKNGKFPKSKAVNIGLDRLSRKDWLCVIDSDIILPPRTREMLEIAKLQKDTLYGCLRMNIIDWDTWIKFLLKPELVYENEIFIHLRYPMGSIISKTYTKDADYFFEPGFLPLGYFQIWNDNGEKKYYPENEKTLANAGQCDLEFALRNFPKRINRQLIPELVCMHLMTSDNQACGTNWSTRCTKTFGPELI